MEYLSVPPTSVTSDQQEGEIPDWIKNNAGWWARRANF